MEEISIYHRPGPFVFIVRDKEGNPLYIGGTENIMAKSFNFKFDYADITGYYYDFPFFWDEVDEMICKYNPPYNSRLHDFYTRKSANDEAKSIFKQYGIPYTKDAQKRLDKYLSVNKTFIYKGIVYYRSDDAQVSISYLCSDYNIDYYAALYN